MSLKKYFDWRTYFTGLYLSWIKSLTSTLIALGGTNAVDAMKLNGLSGVGISMKQAIGVFLGITFWEVVKYVQAKPLPDTITEEVDTTIITNKDLPVWLLIIGLSFASLTGCQTPPQNVAYKAEGVVITTVDSAMKAWGDYVRSHPETPQSQRDTVHKAYDKYFSAQLIARAALETWVASDASSAQWSAANADAVTASTELINIVKGLLK